MIDESRFRDALANLEDDVSHGAHFEEALELNAEEAGLPLEGLRHRAILAWGDLESAEKQLRQAGINSQADEAIRIAARDFAAKAYEARHEVFGQIKLAPIVRIQVWTQSNYKDERSRRLALLAGRARLKELGSRDFFA